MNNLWLKQCTVKQTCIVRNFTSTSIAGTDLIQLVRLRRKVAQHCSGSMIMCLSHDISDPSSGNDCSLKYLLK